MFSDESIFIWLVGQKLLQHDDGPTREGGIRAGLEHLRQVLFRCPFSFTPINSAVLQKNSSSSSLMLKWGGESQSKVSDTQQHKHFYRSSICHSEHLLQPMIAHRAWNDDRIYNDLETFQGQKTFWKMKIGFYLLIWWRDQWAVWWGSIFFMMFILPSLCSLTI